LKNGGQAFSHNPNYPESGASIRDYFAAAALTGLVQLGRGGELSDIEESADDIARLAHCLADSMLWVRKREKRAMERREALAEIKQAGWHDDTDKADIVQAQKHIDPATSRKEFLDGKKMKKRGEPCDCPKCKEGGTHGK
jgi:hypothetical protein